MKRESLKEINNHILTLKLPVSLFGSCKTELFSKIYFDCEFSVLKCFTIYVKNRICLKKKTF